MSSRIVGKRGFGATRRTLSLAGCCLAFSLTVTAQTVQVLDDAQLPRFEVASVRPADPGTRGASIGFPPGRFVQQNMNLVLMLQMAFGVRPNQLDNLPEMVTRDRFTVNASMPAGAPRADGPLMVRALLIDRFKLRYHVEQRQRDGYRLTLARNDRRLGPGLRETPVDCNARTAALRLNQTLPPQPSGTAECGIRNGPGTLDAGGVSMSVLVQMLSNQADAPIVDQTGLTGGFDVKLQWSLESSALRANPSGPPGLGDGPSIFTAVQEQLGLKLEPAKVPTDHVVVDHIERPEPD